MRCRGALIEQNTSGPGNAYAGQTAAAENASTIYCNPAGMTLLPGRQVSGTFNVIRPTTELTDNGGSRSPAGAAMPAASATRMRASAAAAGLVADIVVSA